MSSAVSVPSWCSSALSLAPGGKVPFFSWGKLKNIFTFQEAKLSFTTLLAFRYTRVSLTGLHTSQCSQGKY